MNFRSTRINRFIFMLLLSIGIFSLSFFTSMTAATDDAAPKAPLSPDINTALMKSTFKIVGDNGRVWDCICYWQTDASFDGQQSLLCLSNGSPCS